MYTSRKSKAQSRSQQKEGSGAVPTKKLARESEIQRSSNDTAKANVCRRSATRPRGGDLPSCELYYEYFQEVDILALSKLRIEVTESIHQAKRGFTPKISRLSQERSLFCFGRLISSQLPSWLRTDCLERCRRLLMTSL